jgi:cytidylate kinase
MIVTIDGPAGAGKSSAARALAARLNFRFLDTGAMYRAVAYVALARGIDVNDPAAVARMAERLQIEIADDHLLVDGVDVSPHIRTLEVTAATKYAADNPAVRAHLVKLQQAFGQGCNIVTEGRDQGTVVFPHAECKIYLTATPAERARRRLQELQSQGQNADFESVLANQTERDARDATRAVGPLFRAADAVELLTDGLSPVEVVDRMEALVRSRIV